MTAFIAVDLVVNSVRSSGEHQLARSPFFNHWSPVPIRGAIVAYYLSSLTRSPIYNDVRATKLENVCGALACEQSKVHGVGDRVMGVCLHAGELIVGYVAVATRFPKAFAALAWVLCRCVAPLASLVEDVREKRLFPVCSHLGSLSRAKGLFGYTSRT